MPRRKPEGDGPSMAESGKRKAKAPARTSKKPAGGRKAPPRSSGAGKKAKGSAKAAKASTAASPTTPPGIGEKPKHAGGRPSDYHAEYAELVKPLAEDGWTDQQIADYFGIGIRTFYAWRAAHPEFRQAVRLGKDGPDDRMQGSLYHRGNGYEWEEEQAIKLREETWINGEKHVTERVEVVTVRRQVPPDTSAAIFWLKNRRGWKDKSEIDHGVTNELATLLGQISGNSLSLV